MQLLRVDERLLLNRRGPHGAQGWATARRLILGVAVLGAVPVGADLAFGWPTDVAVVLEDAVWMAVLHGAMQADHHGLVPHRVPDLLQQVAGVALLLGSLPLLAALPRPFSWLGCAAGRALGILGWLTALAGIGAATLVDGRTFASGGAAALVLRWWWLRGPPHAAAATGAEARDTPVKALPERPGAPAARTRVAARGLLWALVVSGTGHAALSLLTAGPGDAPAPLTLLAAWRDADLPQALVWIALLAVGVGGVIPGWRRVRLQGAGHGLRQRIAFVGIAAAFAGFGAMMGEGRTLSMGLAAALTAVFAALALPGPGRLLLVASPTLLSTAFGAFVGCDQALSSPFVERLSDRAGVFALVVAGQGDAEAAFLSIREDHTLLRLGLHDRVARGLDLRTLPSRALDSQAADGRPRRVYPEEIALLPDGDVLLFSEIPGQVPTVLASRHSPEEPSARAVADWPGFCMVSSWAWDEVRQRAYAGCEWRSQVLDHDPDHLDDVVQRLLPGEGEVEELLRLRPSGPWYSVSLWSSPLLRRFDAGLERVERERRIGSFQWALAGQGEDLMVARFFAGQLWTLDPESLERRAVQRLPFGVRALLPAPRHGVVLAASTYTGELRALDPAGAAPPKVLPIGGWVRDLALWDGGRRVVFGGICGVLSVDLDRWIGRPVGALTGPDGPPTPAPGSPRR